MFRFLLGVLILASNFLGVSRASAEMGTWAGPGAMTMSIPSRARFAALTLALALLLPAAVNAQNAYITNSGSNTVSVIDTATNTVTGAINVGGAPFGVAVTPDGTKVFIANQGSSDISVIDTATNSVVATIFQNRDHRPLGVAVTPDGTKVYIANTIDVGQSRSLSVISTASNTVVAEITVGISTGIAVTPDGTKIYGADGISSVSVVATATETVVGASIPVGSAPFGVAVTPDGAKAYITNRDSGTVSVIATASNTVVATIPVGMQPLAVAVTPDGAKVYITNDASGTVSVIATVSDAVLDTIPVGGAPFGVAVTPDGTKAYVANDAIAGTVSVIDTASNTVVTTIPLGNQPTAFGKFIGGPSHGSPPVISSVSPNPVTGSNSAQPFTINGSNFVTGANVTLRDLTAGQTFANRVASSFSSTQIVINPIFTTAAHSWSVEVINPNGQSSGQFQFQIIAPLGPPPVISSVSPNPVTGSNSAQPLTINGSNFVTGANVTLRDLTAGQTFANRVASSFSSTQIVINPIFTTAAHNWSVEVINPDGQSSGQFPFPVIAPPNLPPVANDQDVTATAGTSVTIDLSKNATGGIPTGAKTSKPTHGTISATFGTSVIYTADACYTGPDSFTFRLTNAFGQSNLAKVTITVNPAGAPAIEVHLIDPYLLDAYHANPAKIAEDSLFAAYNNPAVQAKGLVADGVSAAIAVVKTNSCSGDMSVSTSSNGITLLPYDAQFLDLKNPPKPGAAILPIKAADLAAKGGFAVVLVQAPIGGPAPSFADPIIVTAQLGALTATAQANLVPPSVVLVHGIWDDRHGLGGVDGAGSSNGLAHYLKVTSPWKDYSELYRFDFVQVLCYSKYIGFDTNPDPTLDNAYPDPTLKNNSCEQTSKDAITSRIYALLSELDTQHIVGSRVDVVVHSMGGLAVRNYSAQNWYRNNRNRQQGQFHEIITLDTPELGTQLAYFLDTHSNCTWQQASPIWDVVCGLVSSRTVAECLANTGRPLSAPNLPLTAGAVYSLFPNGHSLKNLKPFPPNIKGADWHAISSVAPYNSALANVLDYVIAAIYPSACAPLPVQDINQILGTAENDAIVTLSSSAWQHTA